MRENTQIHQQTEHSLVFIWDPWATTCHVCNIIHIGYEQGSESELMYFWCWLTQSTTVRFSCLFFSEVLLWCVAASCRHPSGHDLHRPGDRLRHRILPAALLCGLWQTVQRWGFTLLTGPSWTRHRLFTCLTLANKREDFLFNTDAQSETEEWMGSLINKLLKLPGAKH